MSEASRQRRAPLLVEIEPELREQIELAAAKQHLPVREYVARVLRSALVQVAYEAPLGEASTWGRLSAASFARDWASEADQVYDTLS
ncbi:MAG: hypothetical protein ACR2PL_06305 [Dehalococcoidia bacterium]